MTYAQVMVELGRLRRLGIKPGTGRMQRAMARLGWPERQYAVIHVAGTNGKGSTVAMLEAALRRAGWRTGRYTSPHLSRLTERISVAGREIGQDDFVRLFHEVRALAGDGDQRAGGEGAGGGRGVDRVEARGDAKQMGGGVGESEDMGEGGPLTFFETLTAMALLCFARRAVEVAVLESGLGGLLDATNVVDGAVSVVTSVSREHGRYLGGTLAEIAAHKAGVFRRGRPAVAATGSAEAGERLLVEAARRGTSLWLLGREIQLLPQTGCGDGFRVVMPTGEVVVSRLALAGAHQRRNAALAVATLSRFSELTGRRTGSGFVAQALAEVDWPARMERIGGPPPVLLDCAHNPEAAQAMAVELASERRRPRVLLAGLLDDKDAAGVLGPLCAASEALVLTRPSSPRAWAPAELLAACASPGSAVTSRLVGVEVVEAVPAALARAQRLAGQDGLVVACGSVALAGEVRRLLLHEAGDPGCPSDPG